MSITVLDCLTEEDRLAWLEVQVCFDALRFNPRAHTIEESRDVMRTWWQLMAYIAKTYDVDEEQYWRVSAADGTITYGEDE